MDGGSTKPVPAGPERWCAGVRWAGAATSPTAPVSWRQQRWTEHWLEAGEPLLVCECVPWTACPWEACTAEVPGCWTHPGIHPQVNALSAKAALIKADNVERSSALLIPAPS